MNVATAWNTVLAANGAVGLVWWAGIGLRHLFKRWRIVP